MRRDKQTYLKFKPMADDLRKAESWCKSDGVLDRNKTMQNLYNMGYRKQSEGEWIAQSLISTSKRGRTIKYSTYKCFVCGTWNGRHRQNYCPHCGAKMKGSAE